MIRINLLLVREVKQRLELRAPLQVALWALILAIGIGGGCFMSRGVHGQHVYP